jgi:hypothetical protein
MTVNAYDASTPNNSGGAGDGNEEFQAIKAAITGGISVAANRANKILGFNSGGTAIELKAALSSGNYVSVKSAPYNAVGDGVTDDSAAFAAAIAACNTIFIPEGEYLLSSLVTINKSDVTIIGANRDKCRLLANFDTGPVISVGNSSTFTNNVILKNFSVTKNLSGTRSGEAIKLNKCYQFQLEDLNISRCGSGINMLDSVVGWLTKFFIYDTSVGLGAGIIIDGGNDHFISNGVIMTNTGSYSGIDIFDSGASWIRDVDVINFEYGMRIAPTAGKQVEWCFFEAVAFDSGPATGAGVLVFNNAGDYIKGMSFDNCWFASNAIGVQVSNTSSAPIDGLYFNNCKFYANDKQGLSIDVGTNIKNIELATCQIAGNSASISGAYSGVKVANGVTGFKARNCTIGTCSDFTTVTQKYGIECAGSSITRMMVTDCDLQGNSVAGMHTGGVPAGNKLVTHNLGYLTENVGADTLPVGSQTKVVTHNMPEVAGGIGSLHVDLTPMAAKSASGITDVWVDSIGTSTFTVKANTTVAGTGFAFSWRATKDVFNLGSY